MSVGLHCTCQQPLLLCKQTLSHAALGSQTSQPFNFVHIRAGDIFSLSLNIEKRFFRITAHDLAFRRSASKLQFMRHRSSPQQWQQQVKIHDLGPCGHKAAMCPPFLLMIRPFQRERGEGGVLRYMNVSIIFSRPRQYSMLGRLHTGSTRYLKNTNLLLTRACDQGILIFTYFFRSSSVSRCSCCM